MTESARYAPGKPGLEPTWTSSSKSGAGTALNPASRVWFTLNRGILNEVYFLHIDRACTRDMGFIVTDGHELFCEEKKDTDCKIEYLADGVPGYRLLNTCLEGRYRIEKEIIAVPGHDCVLQHTRFIPLKGDLSDYRLYVLLSPHIGNQGYGNTAWVGDYKGAPMLFAERKRIALALACSVPWAKRSAGYVGVSDGWQDLFRHKRMEWSYDRAEDGNVALTGEIDLKSCSGVFTLALGFGEDFFHAGYQARSSLQEGFDAALKEFVFEWQEWQRTLPPMEDVIAPKNDLYRISMMMIKAHQSKSIPGAIIASLTFPWGFSKGDKDAGGYHVVWPRDAAEVAGAQVACGGRHDALQVLSYLRATQEEDGHWPQNMWINGRGYYSSIQLGEAALPPILLDLLLREGGFGADESPLDYWPMVRKAAKYIVLNGPATAQDRWEAASGYTPFTLATLIAALLVAAKMAELGGESHLAAYFRETADAWNDSIEEWIYATDTELAHRLGVEGYYVRITPADEHGSVSPLKSSITIRNRPGLIVPAAEVVSPDALALVRFGLRAANDRRILNTVKVIDALLKVETPYGPLWRRYSHDGYGEHEDGRPFDGIGIGRAWPLLTGERAHYEIAAGNLDEAGRLAAAIEHFTNSVGFIPEQIWDSPDIPEKGLKFARPSGSAMPLVWAHSEYVKLRRSLQENRVFDMPQLTVKRYLVDGIRSSYAIWRFGYKRETIATGKTLRIEVESPALVRWTTDYWKSSREMEARDTQLCLYIADLPTHALKVNSRVLFTFYWPKDGKWEGSDFEVKVVEER